jgi:phosphatidylglycerol:prolipoprotein diacylglycerol transferase
MPDYLVSFPGLGINDLPISRVAFEFNIFGRTISIYWYGILIALAFLLCMLLSIRAAKVYDLNPDHLSEVYLLIIPLALIGARLYYVAFAWDEFSGNLSRIIDTRTGGLAFYGGVIGGVIAVLIWSFIRKVKFSCIADFLIVYVPLGQAIGRWGNFFNQEAFGVNTGLPWGMISNGTTAYLAAHKLPGVNPYLPVHPTFLYEFVANLVIFFVLFFVRKNVTKPYYPVATYLLLYGSVRFFVESLRTDPLFIGTSGIRISQALSLAMILVALVIYVVFRKRYRTVTPKQIASLEDDDVEILD